MNRQDLQLEELTVAEAIGLAFHGLDLGVGAFQGAGGYRVVVPGQDTRLMLLESIGEPLEQPDARGARTGQPVAEYTPGRALVGLVPDLPQILLEIVGDGQRLVQTQGPLQPLVLVALGIQVLRVFQQQPARTLEDASVAVAEGLVVQSAPQGTELVVEQLDDMEMIEDMDRVGQVVADRANVGLGHVGGHGPDLGVGATQPPPEWLQGLGALAVADENDGAGEQVQDQSDIVVSLTDRDLVDGDFLEFVQLGFAEAALQVPLLDVLDNVPTDLQVPGRVLDGGAARQLQGIAFEVMGVSAACIREGNLDLPGMLAAKADDACHLEADEAGLAADRDGSPDAFLAPLGVHHRRAAGGAAELVARLLDGEEHLPFDVV